MIWWMTFHGHGGLKGAVIFSSFVQAAAVAPINDILIVLHARNLELDDSHVL